MRSNCSQTFLYNVFTTVILFVRYLKIVDLITTFEAIFASKQKLHCEKGFGTAAVSAQNKYTCAKNAMEKSFLSCVIADFLLEFDFQFLAIKRPTYFEDKLLVLS